MLCIELNWKDGDVVWAKFMSWPWWPAIVYRHSSGHYKDNDIFLHFVDTVPRTAWVYSKYVFLVHNFCAHVIM